MSAAQFPLHRLFPSLSEISPPSVQLVRQASPAVLVISPADEQLVTHAFPAALVISASAAQLIRQLSCAAFTILLVGQSLQIRFSFINWAVGHSSVQLSAVLT